MMVTPLSPYFTMWNIKHDQKLDMRDCHLNSYFTAVTRAPRTA
jgi:hypothetical protein